MIDLWRPIVASCVAAFAGFVVDHAVPIAPRKGAAKWPLFALTAWVSAYLVVVLPLVGAIAAAVLVARRRTTRNADETLLPSSVHSHRALAFAILAFAAVLLIARPSTPCYWDEFVWLGKARLAAPFPDRLVQAALRRDSLVAIPRGYPLFEPLGVAWLGMLSPAPTAIVAGALGFEALAVVLFLFTLVDAEGECWLDKGRALLLASGLLLTCPLVLVHLRSAYVDLPVGLFAASLALLLPRAGTGVACVVVAIALASMKDEGLAHVVAIAVTAGALSFSSRRPSGTGRPTAMATRSLRGRAAASVLFPCLAVFAWHSRLRTAGVLDLDHPLGLPSFGRVVPLLRLVCEHASDVSSWGGLWICTLGTLGAILTLPRPGSPATVWFGATFIAQAVLLFGALLSGPERVMEFASGGTLLNRLGIQLAPSAALVVAAWFGHAKREG